MNAEGRPLQIIAVLNESVAAEYVDFSRLGSSPHAAIEVRYEY
jgi:hypothetical protein